MTEAAAEISSEETHYVGDNRHSHSFLQSVVLKNPRQAAGLDPEARPANVVVILEVLCRCADPDFSFIARGRRATGTVTNTTNESAGITRLASSSPIDPELGIHFRGNR